MEGLSVAEAAERLGVSTRRVQQFVATGRLPAEKFGGSFLIKEKDLILVANRKPGRPPNPVETKGQKKSTRLKK